jgi:hypothetical protein
MIDELREILSATHKLGFLPIVKIVGTPATTELHSIAPDKSVVLDSNLIQPVADFDGIFGLHDLGRLDIILNIPEYKDNAFVTVTKLDVNGRKVPTGISFENANRDFRNDFRLMSQDVVESQVPFRNRKDIQWDVTIQPTVNAIQRLKYQSQAAGSTEGTFSARTDKGNLLFSLGDHSSHTGEFLFADNVNGQLKTPREWPLMQVQAILNMNGDKVLKISDLGAMEISVTTGLAVHQFTVLSSAK